MLREITTHSVAAPNVVVHLFVQQKFKKGRFQTGLLPGAILFSFIQDMVQEQRHRQHAAEKEYGDQRHHETKISPMRGGSQSFIAEDWQSTNETQYFGNLLRDRFAIKSTDRPIAFPRRSHPRHSGRKFRDYRVGAGHVVLPKYVFVSLSSTGPRLNRPDELTAFRASLF